MAIPLVIRPYEPADREDAIALVDQLNRYEGAIAGDRAISHEAAEACLESDLAVERDGHGAIYVAEKVDGLVGLMALRLDAPLPYLRREVARVCWISELVVDKRARGTGVGRALVQEGERWARRAGAGRMMIGAIVGNHPALAAYEAYGFKRSIVELAKDLPRGGVKL